ncbi:MAG TPA: hypothetical protein VGR07_06805 [Thermoanaerobaculia bacterium]|nr:hypothetical protein [Thermoanaerobaculia bacterium]
MRRLLFFAWLLVAAGLPAQGAEPLAPPVWPSLAEQIDRAGILAGSALARLVAANQDFRLLRPEEARDSLRLPLWLRVLWRKVHPAATYPAADPTGGYPFVLKEAYEWMLSHQDLVPGEAPPSLPPEQTVTTGSDHRISGPQTAPRSESDIRVNFLDPSRILSASNDIEQSGRQAVYYSSDGGTTWGQTSLPLLAGDAFHSDPTVDWTSDGTAWSTTIGINPSGTVLHLRAYKSTDGGATWTFDATFSGTQGSADKQMIWGDHSATSPYKDNLYAIWHDGATAVYTNRRTGPGGAWQTPLQVSHGETTGTGIGGDVKTNSAGDVFGFWPDTGSRRIFVVKSTDGGATFGTPVPIATTFGSFEISLPAFASRKALIYAAGGAYRTADKNLVYASWTDLSGAAGCTLPANPPGTNAASTCKSRIWFARSTDGGATWQPAVRLNDPPSANDQFNPWLAVDEVNGSLGVIYYDTVGDAGRKRTDVYYQSSFDDGLTWSSPLKVSSGMTDETVVGADSGNQYGDYNGLSGYAARFFSTWTDRRSNTREEVWTAEIDDPPCTPPGVPAIGTATTPAGNEVQLTWSNGAPAAAHYDVYRALGTCAAPGAFQKIAGPLAATSFLDTTVSGTLSYAYRVTGLDPTDVCQSAPSGCAEVVANGPCNAAPSFAGLQAVANAGTASCGLALSWAAGTASCAGPLTYRVYRGSSSGFVPGPANLVAAGLTGTSYLDTALLNSGTTYTYVVRAVGANGVEEGNAVQKSASPTAAAAPGTLTETFEGSLAGGFDTPGWTHSALAGGVDWAWNGTRSQTPTHSWYSASQGSISDRVLVSPPFTVQAGTTLSFWHTFAFEGTTAQCYDGGTLEITTDGGGHWSPLPGGLFNAGGFNGTVSTIGGNPIGGLRAWCSGTLGAMTQVSADLSSYAGLPARLRWHAGDDSITGLTGWYVDSVTLANAVVAGACTPGPSAAMAYYTLAPCRLVDTRNPAGPAGGPALAAGAQRSFTLAGICGVPATARALSVNVTVVGPATAGDLRLFAAGQPTPLVSAINFTAGQTRTNNAALGLAWGAGTVTAQNDAAGTVHLIVDVNGYYQ